MKSSILGTAIVLILITGGTVAYACGGGGGGKCSDTVLAGGQAGGSSSCKPDIVWENPSSIAASVPTVTCKYTLTQPTITVAVGNLASGESCLLKATLVNIGNADATLSQSISITPGVCTFYSFSDTIPSGHVLNAGGSLAVQATIGLAALAGNKCQHTSTTIFVTVDGTG